MQAMDQLYDSVERRRIEMEHWNRTLKNDVALLGPADESNPKDDGADSDDFDDDGMMCDEDGEACCMKGAEGSCGGECKMHEAKIAGQGSPPPPLEADPASSKPSQTEPVMGVPVLPQKPISHPSLILQQAGVGPLVGTQLGDASPLKKAQEKKKTAQDAACCVVM